MALNLVLFINLVTIDIKFVTKQLLNGVLLHKWQHDRDIRSSSFIISGLLLSVVYSDKYIVMELCLNEFNIQVDIVSTKSLHKASPSSNKIQPLLVDIKNVDHAKHIISSARQLRQSIASLVRDIVYINPNLTKAEASAAYELRCSHREAANRRSTAGDRPVTLSINTANAEGVLLGNLLGLVSDSSATVDLTTTTSTSTLSCQSSLHSPMPLLFCVVISIYLI